MKHTYLLLAFLYSFTCTLYTAASDSFMWQMAKMQDSAPFAMCNSHDDEERNSMLSCCRPYAQSCIEHYDPRCRTTILGVGCISIACSYGGYAAILPHIDSTAIQLCLALPVAMCFPLWAGVMPDNRRRIAQCIIDCFGLNPADLNKKVPYEDGWR